MKRANKETDNLLLAYLEELLRDTRKHLNRLGVIDSKLRIPRSALYGYVEAFSKEVKVHGYILSKLDDIGSRQPTQRLSKLLAERYVTAGKYGILVCCVPKEAYQGVSTADCIYSYLRKRKLQALAALTQSPDAEEA